MSHDETIEQVTIRGEIAKDLNVLYKYRIKHEIIIQDDQLIVKINDISDAVMRYDIKERWEK